MVAKRPTKQNPKIILYNLSPEVKEEELKEAMQQQNQVSQTKIIFSMKRKTETN